MKNMKGLIVLALFLGFVGVAQSGGRQGQGWSVTYVTGTHAVIADGPARSYLKSVTLSTANTATVGDGVVCYSSNPTSVGGAGQILLSTAPAWIVQYQMTPAIVYAASMSYVNNNFSALNVVWSAGPSEDDFVEIPGNGALVCRQTSAGSGQANTFAVQWGR